MKRIFTLACVAAMATTAFAQAQESAFVDNAKNGVEGKDKNSAISIAAGTVIASSTNVSMKIAFADTWQESSLYGESDIATQVVINGTTYSLVKGIQGETNPTPLGFAGGQNTGAVFQFDVKTDGYLYVIGKYSGNKQYYVWEGDVPNAQGQPVAYTFVGQPAKADGVVSVSLPADNSGYYTVGAGYDDGATTPAIASLSLCIDGATAIAEAKAAGTDILKGYGTKWTSEGGNALGVLAFPVYAEAGVYYVNATGSKLTANGFVFVPGAKTIGTVSFAKGSNAIHNITLDELDENAPVYNVLGQRVSKSHKGICIQNGKKFIVK